MKLKDKSDSDMDKVKALREQLEDAKRAHHKHQGAVETLLAQANEKYSLDGLEELSRAIEETQRSRERASKMLREKIAELESRYAF